MSQNTPLIPSQLFAITLGCRDVGDQRRFYESWGWQAVPYSNDEYVSFNLNGVMVAFFPTAKLGEEAAPGEPLPSAKTWNGVTLAVSVPTKDDVDRVWGGRSGYIADPEGNRWEIAWVPPTSN